MKFLFPNRTFVKRSLLILLSLLVLSGTIALSNYSKAQAQPASRTIAQQPTANLTIAEIIAQSSEYDNNDQDFDVLLNALKQTGLIESLANKATSVTVFAPTDAAFLRLSRTQFGYSGNDEAAVIDAISAGFAEFKRVDVERGASPNSEPFKLREVLLYHILKEAKTSVQLRRLTGSDRVVQTLNDADGVSPIGSPIAFIGDRIVHLAPGLVEPKIQQGLTDIQASNGMIQGIDQVLFPYYLEPIVSPRPAPKAGEPKTIADVLYQSGGEFDNNDQDYDILINLLQTAGLTDVLSNPNANLTLFAPNDAAFIKRDQKPGEIVEDNSFQKRFPEQYSYFEVVTSLLTADQIARKIPIDLGMTGNAVPLLQKVLKYHLSEGAKTAAQIRAASTINTLLNGEVLTVENGKLVDRTPKSTAPKLQAGRTDIRASNGTIQGIDNILLPSFAPRK